MPTPVAPAYIPGPLQDVWLAAFIDAGGVAAGSIAIFEATQAMREDSRYETFFPGNRREDGTFRFSEEEYYLETLAFDDVFAGYGINPESMRDRYGELIAGDVSFQELERRVGTVYEGLVEQAPEVLEFYRTNFGLQSLQFEDVVAAALDPALGEEILVNQVRVSAVGGAALQAGFNIASTFADAILDQGLGSFEEASAFFQQAAGQIPILDVLARRHSDPDDDFDLEEFTAAALFNDPTERRRLLRLIRQSQAGFGVGPQFRREGEGLTGLLAQ